MSIVCHGVEDVAAGAFQAAGQVVPVDRNCRELNDGPELSFPVWGSSLENGAAHFQGRSSFS